MDLRRFQDLMRETYLERDRRRWSDGTFRWLTEEVGELARSLRREDPDQRAHEFSDVLAWLASLANQAGVDLEAAAGRYASGCPKCGHIQPLDDRPVLMRGHRHMRTIGDIEVLFRPVRPVIELLVQCNQRALSSRNEEKQFVCLFKGIINDIACREVHSQFRHTPSHTFAEREKILSGHIPPSEHESDVRRHEPCSFRFMGRPEAIYTLGLARHEFWIRQHVDL
jgi:NTP pyrophosphatase (non-canonical NTP hydrolase)